MVSPLLFATCVEVFGLVRLRPARCDIWLTFPHAVPYCRRSKQNVPSVVRNRDATGSHEFQMTARCQPDEGLLPPFTVVLQHCDQRQSPRTPGRPRAICASRVRPRSARSTRLAPPGRGQGDHIRPEPRVDVWRRVLSPHVELRRVGLAHSRPPVPTTRRARLLRAAPQCRNGCGDRRRVRVCRTRIDYWMTIPPSIMRS